MKLQEDYMLNSIAGSKFLIPIGTEVVNVQHILNLNEVAYYILELLQNQDLTEGELVDLLEQEFEAEREVITQDVKEFVLNGLRDGYIV